VIGISRKFAFRLVICCGIYQRNSGSEVTLLKVDDNYSAPIKYSSSACMTEFIMVPMTRTCQSIPDYRNLLDKPINRPVTYSREASRRMYYVVNFTSLNPSVLFDDFVDYLSINVTFIVIKTI
jgi:hypothetical protein